MTFSQQKIAWLIFCSLLLLISLTLLVGIPYLQSRLIENAPEPLKGKIHQFRDDDEILDRIGGLRGYEWTNDTIFTDTLQVRAKLVFRGNVKDFYYGAIFLLKKVTGSF